MQKLLLIHRHKNPSPTSCLIAGKSTARTHEDLLTAN